MNRFYETSELAKNNVKYRPIYSSEIADYVIEYYREHKGHKGKIETMLDVGCGTGQTANVFHSFCNKIIASDISEEQLKQASLQNKYENIQYIMGEAERLENEDNSVDLVVAGMSAHWFDLPKFYQEAKRVLKPSGCLSIFAYYTPEISLLGSNDVKVSRLGTSLLRSLLVYAASECPISLSVLSSLENHYDDIFAALPFQQKRKIDDVHVVTTASINDICGYIRSVYLRQHFMSRRIRDLKSLDVTITKNLLDMFDLAAQFKILIKKLWKLKDVSDDEKIIKVDYPFFILLAKT